MNSILRRITAIDRKYWPLMVTIGLFLLTYLGAAIKYPGILSTRVFFNLLIDNSFLIISAIGTTFVILSGGIDLSTGALIALTAMLSAWMMETLGLSPLVTIPTALLVGCLFGAGMGVLIQKFKLPPFVATLIGMFTARGLCFVLSVNSIVITDPLYGAISQYRITFPDKSFISINVVIALIVLAVAIFLAAYTRFGRAVYAIGGNNGANEQSALLMGLPVARTKILIYTLNGFCSALAGIVFSLYVLSGYGWYVNGFELDVISSVVIGGTPLTGGVGFPIGTLFGVLIQGLIQTIISFDGTLNSWWTKIVVGLLTLFFILMQRALSGNRK
jgi:simple sugar transport system permease protein